VRQAGVQVVDEQAAVEATPIETGPTELQDEQPDRHSSKLQLEEPQPTSRLSARQHNKLRQDVRSKPIAKQTSDARIDLGDRAM